MLSLQARLKDHWRGSQKATSHDAFKEEKNLVRVAEDAAHGPLVAESHVDAPPQPHPANKSPYACRNGVRTPKPGWRLSINQCPIGMYQAPAGL